MMKQNVIKCFAAFVAMMYLIGVTGFDVHICQRSGEAFVAPLVEGETCNDFHPGHSCRHDCRAAVHDMHSHICCVETSFSDGGCCSDEMFRLVMTGIAPGGRHHHSHNHCKCLCGHCPLSAELGSESFQCCGGSEPVPLHGIPVPDLLRCRSLLNIWRL